jgi:hypothetical protein
MYSLRLNAFSLLVSGPVAVILYYVFWGSLPKEVGQTILWLVIALGLPWNIACVLLAVLGQVALGSEPFDRSTILALGEGQNVLRGLVWGMYWSFVVGVHANVYCLLRFRDWRRRRRLARS